MCPCLLINIEVKQLLNLLAIEMPPKGGMFPTVTGPELQDNVCIVGAGSAGIHMALSLKDMGYKNITILEKTDRVGGKIKDLTIDGYYRPLGPMFLNGDYFDNVIKLAKKYNLGELNPIPMTGVSTD